MTFQSKMRKWWVAGLLALGLGVSGFAWQSGTLNSFLPVAFTSQSGAQSVPSTCLDGTALTVIGEDANQVNYKCGSGAIGAYTKPQGGAQ